MTDAITKLIELVEAEAAHKAALAEIEPSDSAARAVYDVAKSWAQLADRARKELAAIRDQHA